MSDENIQTIKLWKLESYSYKKNVVEPLSRFLNLSPREVKELLAKNLDMVRIEASHSSAEQAKLFRMERQFQVDLGLDYLLQLELLSKDQIALIQDNFRKEVEKSGKLDFDENSPEYNQLLNDARSKILKILKEN